MAIELIKRSIEAGERMPNEEEKSLENIGLINTANEIANKYAKFYGVDKPFDIPLENIHILSHYSDKTEGDWIAEDCMITVKERHDDTKIDLARKLFHELIHSKSYNVIKSELKDGKLNLINYGSGIGINLKRKDGRGYQDNNFFSLNEAITEMLTERFYNECKNNGIFSSEEVLDYEQRGGGKVYLREQLELAGIFRKIYEKNINSYADISENEAINSIRTEFIKAYFTGNFISLGKLVERVFGPGSLRQINHGPFSEEGLDFNDYGNKFISKKTTLDDLN